MEAEILAKINAILQDFQKLHTTVTKLEDISVSTAEKLENLEERVSNSQVNLHETIPGIGTDQNNDAQVNNHSVNSENTENKAGQQASDNPDTEGVSENYNGQSSDISVNNSVDPQSEFGAIKEAVNRIKLPSDLRLNDSKQGIRREDQQALNVITRSARYVETTIKLLGTLNPDTGKLSLDEYSDLYNVQLAHIRYLQDEYSALVVQNKFNKQTAQMFRSLQRNTSGLNERSLDTLKLATSITATAAGSSSASGGGASSDFNWRERRRGGGNSFRGGRGYRGGGNDMYHRFASRNIPTQRPHQVDSS